jgi:hypothetical protein
MHDVGVADNGDNRGPGRKSLAFFIMRLHVCSMPQIFGTTGKV